MSARLTKSVSCESCSNRTILLDITAAEFSADSLLRERERECVCVCASTRARACVYARRRLGACVRACVRTYVRVCARAHVNFHS